MPKLKIFPACVAADGTQECVLTKYAKPTINQLMHCPVLVEEIGHVDEDSKFVTGCWPLLEGGSGDPKQFGDGKKGAVDSPIESINSGRKIPARTIGP